MDRSPVSPDETRATTRRRRAPAVTQAFSYRSGVRLTGTILGCDVAGGTGLGFLSNAFTTPAALHTKNRLGGARAQWLASDLTLALLGATGVRLRRQALTPAPGRPFTVGDLRLELLPMGTFPGASALFVEASGRRALYTGPLGRGAAHERALRPAEALCLDATFGDPQFVFPPQVEAWAALEASITRATNDGRPVVLVAPLDETTVPLLVAWAAGARTVRAHRAIVDQASTLRRAGVPCAVPLRFNGKADPGDVVLWPHDRHDAPQLRRLTNAFTLFVSGWALDAGSVQRLGVDAAVPWTPLADHAGLLSFAKATGAREIATVGAGAAALAARLASGAQGTAYPLVPPQQIGLFG